MPILAKDYISAFSKTPFMKYTFHSLLICLFIFACGGEVSESMDDPTNLELDVVVYDDNSGTVVVNASAQNTVEFQFFMGEDQNLTHSSASGYFEYTYATTGSYTIEVRAIGSSQRYIRKERTITVISEDPINVGEGYSTPLVYEGMDLVWNDEFEGSSLNTSDWSYDIGTGCPSLCGWGNNELEYYRKENSWLEDGLLFIEARKENFQGSNYTSTKIVTRDKRTFQYGRIDIRAKMPRGQGIWPALWMLGENQSQVGWPKCGEIDIMEMIGGNNRENTVSANVFWDKNGLIDSPKTLTLSSGFLYDKFFVYSIVWDENKIEWFLDDVLYHSFDITTDDKNEFHRPFYMIINVAVGGNWPGNPNASTNFPTQMLVDYVRVFQKS